MQVILHDGRRFLLRFDSGEELVSALTLWCRPAGVAAASFSGIGACREVTLAHIDPQAKAYTDHVIREDLEICSLVGNVALAEGEATVHAHGTFADRDLRVLGGHVQRLVISVTGEVELIRWTGAAQRCPDAAAGIRRLEPQPTTV